MKTKLFRGRAGLAVAGALAYLTPGMELAGGAEAPKSGMELVSFGAAFGPHALIADMRVSEPEQFKSLHRVEISLRDSGQKELFRAMFNASSKVAPIPPTAFGVFPVGDKDPFTIHDIRSAGLGATYPAESRFATLLPETSAGSTNGVLRIEWWIRPKTWPPTDPTVLIYGKTVPAKSNDGEWVKLGVLTIPAEEPVAAPVTKDDLDRALGWVPGKAEWADLLKGARYIRGGIIKAAAEGALPVQKTVERALDPPELEVGPEPPEIAGVIDRINYDICIVAHTSEATAHAGMAGMIAGDRKDVPVGDEGCRAGSDSKLFPQGGEAVSLGQRIVAFRVGRFCVLIQQGWQGRLELPDGAHPVRTLLDEDLMRLARAVAQRAGAGGEPAGGSPSTAAAPQAAQPDYGVKFDELLALEAKGDIGAAIRLIPGVYGCDIPVDAFHRTLEAARTRLLDRLVAQKRFKTSGATFEFGTLRTLFGMQELAKPDVMCSKVVVKQDLPVERYLYYMAVAGTEPKGKATDPLTIPALPDFEPGATVTSHDPWIVSASLFLARKGHGKVTPQAVIDRWSSRPDLWDDTCTEQALLFLASQEAQAVAGLTVANDDVKRELGRLEKPVPGKVEVQVFFFDIPSCGQVRPGRVTLVSLKQGATSETYTVTGDRPVLISESADAVVAVEPGVYRFKCVDGPLHGSSRIFEADNGKFVRVCTGTMGGI